MEEARRVLARLDRIDDLRQGPAAPNALLGELQALLAEAEAWVRVDRVDPRAHEAVGRVREALGQGEIQGLGPKRTLVA